MNPPARLAALLVLVAGTALTAGQAPAPAQTPTFKVQIDYVEVDALVVDAKGALVRDLKKEDFQVFEDGKAQTISAFSLVDIPVERYQRPLYSPQPIEPDIQTNERPFDGRMYVAVIDDLHTNFFRTSRVRAAARKFIEEHLGANDLMAVVHTAGPADASQDFTSNKRLLLASVDRTSGLKIDSATVTRTGEFFQSQQLGVRQAGEPVSDPEESERAFNAKRSLDSLRNIARWFAGVHNRRKTILFFSEGIDYDVTNVLRDRNASLLLDSTREAIAAASTANVSIYGIDPRGLTDLGDETIALGGLPNESSLGIGQRSVQQEIQLAQASLHELAEQTGGFAAVNANDFASAFDRIVRDNSTYYVLAYYPPVDKPGKVHKIDVRVSRPGLTVRARKAHVTPKPAPARDAKAKNAPPASKLMTPELREALDSPIQISGVTLHVFAAPFKGPAPNASVMLGVDVRGRDLRLTSGDKLTLSWVATDPQGKTRGATTSVLTINLKPETKTRVEETGFRLVNRLELPPGRYQVRVAAHDSGGGRVGSVVHDVTVPDFSKGPLTMSGVAIASALGAATPIAQLDEQVRAMVPAVPVAARTFARDDELMLFAEVYDNEASKPHKVDISSTVTSDEGREMFKAEEVRDSTDLNGKGGGYGYVARIPLRDIAPGSYVLTLAARSRLGDGSKVERQVQFRVGGGR